MTETLEVRASPRRLTRSAREKTIAGVCGGLAEYFVLDPIVVRIAYVVVTVVTGLLPGVLAYIISIFLMPPPDSDAT